MFREYLKGSLGVLPWLLLPVLCYVVFIIGIDPYYIELYGYAANVVPDHTWGQFAAESALVSLIIALLVHINLLLIVPCAIGGASANTKHFQFFLGFFTNIALSMLVPIYFKVTFGLDATTLIILIVTHLIQFPATFIIGSRFVSPVYRRAFWF